MPSTDEAALERVDREAAIMPFSLSDAQGHWTAGAVMPLRPRRPLLEEAVELDTAMRLIAWQALWLPQAERALGQG